MDSLFNGGYLFRGDGARGDHRIFVCIHAKYCWSDVYGLFTDEGVEVVGASLPG
ncbi:Uncharacterised protein [Mycobacteroides abscessus subsp. abscessus]|nr:Uncharacterised protein [Mycobacteroides abscessus subsp. abscessus]